jgi:membrane protease YdiL (CAAX protease family)
MTRPGARPLIAPIRHTVILIAILLAIAAYGFSMQHAAAGKGPPSGHSGSALPLYLSLLVAEWLLLRFVVAGGLRKTGTRLRDIIGPRWSGWKDIARDAVIAFLVWAAWVGLTTVLEHTIGGSGAKDLATFLPRGPAEIAAWIALSLTAGFCEEAIYRGYLQTQFEALTGSAAAAILGQAVIFGVSHGYQGVRNVIVITVYAAIIGSLARWRKSLKPGMIVHAWTDIFGGLIEKSF